MRLGQLGIDQLAALQPLDEGDAEPLAEDAEVLQSLMSVGSRSALEFLA